MMSRQTQLGRGRRLDDLRKRLRLCKKHNAQLREKVTCLRRALETQQTDAGALAYALEGLIKDPKLTHEERVQKANGWLAGVVAAKEARDV